MNEKKVSISFSLLLDNILHIVWNIVPLSNTALDVSTTLFLLCSKVFMKLLFLTVSLINLRTAEIKVRLNYTQMDSL